MDRRNRDTPWAKTLESLLAEYEPTGLRRLRRMWYRYTSALLMGWALLALLHWVPGVGHFVESRVAGATGLLGGLTCWLTWGLLATLLFSTYWALMAGRLLLGILGLMPFTAGHLMFSRGGTGPHPLWLLGVVLAEILLTLNMSTPSLGDSARDQVVGRATEALAWLVFWARSEWNGASRRLLRGLLRHFHLQGLRLKMHFLRLDEQYSLSDQQEESPSPARSAERLGTSFLSAARQAGLSDPEVHLFALVLKAVEVLGFLTESQGKYLRALGKSLGLDDHFVAERVETARELARPMSRQKAAELLGVSPEAAPEEVETAFRQAMERVGQESGPLLAKARSVLLRRR